MSFIVNLSAQEAELPYHQIPDHPEEYTAGTVAARIVDGLGFRFYWATEGLRKEDLDFRPTAEARNVSETIDHIHSMTLMLANVVNKSARERKDEMSFEEKRAEILRTLFEVSTTLRNSSEDDLKTYVRKSSSGEETPFWFMLNGPIADCTWHCGQIASFRRLSGNPFNSKVSLFHGILIED